MKRYQKMLMVVGGFVLIGTVLPGPWRMAPLRAGPPAQGSRAVRPAPVGQRLGANPGQKGATYYALEAQASRITAKFADAVAVAERNFEGDLITRLTDLHGNEVARFKVDRIDGVNDVLQYVPHEGRSVQAFSEPGVRPTLDWSNHQAYSLWKDRAESNDVSLEWQDSLMRRKGAARRDLQKATVELHTEWASGFSSTTVRTPVSNHDFLPGRTLKGDVLITHLTRDGVEQGLINWYPESQVLVWNIPGLTKGYLAPEHLKDQGGWPFTPDMAWLNLQATAFHQFKTQIQKNGFVASRQPGWLERTVGLLMPTLHAEEGCDGLHWLDGTVLRFCCDIHDICYVKNGCSAQTWWKLWTSWQCDYCNAWAVTCFVNGGVVWNDWGMPK